MVPFLVNLTHFWAKTNPWLLLTYGEKIGQSLVSLKDSVDSLIEEALVLALKDTSDRPVKPRLVQASCQPGYSVTNQFCSNSSSLLESNNNVSSNTLIVKSVFWGISVFRCLHFLKYLCLSDECRGKPMNKVKLKLFKKREIFSMYRMEKGCDTQNII